MAGLTKYRATSAVIFGAGAVLGLSEDQAAARGVALAPLGKGLYSVRHPVQFKAGEELAVDGELPKALADNLETVTKVARAKAQADDRPLLVDGA